MFLLQTKRAENGTRTRDPDLGKVVLYQLSYSRVLSLSHEEEHFSKCGAKVAHFFEPPKYFTTFFIINRFLFICDHIASCHGG